MQGEHAPGQALRLSYNILQAAGTRIFKTDYVACPTCGRTLFNLQTTTARIKAATVHLKGVKIAIMGCIVNGPGEMADADFGYVGGAPGKVNLYVGKTPVKFNIPESRGGRSAAGSDPRTRQMGRSCRRSAGRAVRYRRHFSLKALPPAVSFGVCASRLERINRIADPHFSLRRFVCHDPRLVIDNSRARSTTAFGKRIRPNPLIKPL